MCKATRRGAQYLCVPNVFTSHSPPCDALKTDDIVLGALRCAMLCAAEGQGGHGCAGTGQRHGPSGGARLVGPSHPPAAEVRCPICLNCSPLHIVVLVPVSPCDSSERRCQVHDAAAVGTGRAALPDSSATGTSRCTCGGRETASTAACAQALKPPPHLGGSRLLQAQYTVYLLSTHCRDLWALHAVPRYVQMSSRTRLFRRARTPRSGLRRRRSARCCRWSAVR